MSTYVLMKILESAPGRYDWGIRLLTLGRLDRRYDRLVEPIHSGDTVLDVGCGTGALSLRAVRKGAKVKGIDLNPEMLEIARKRATEEGLEDQVTYAELGVAELDREPSGAYDTAVSGLCFSELSPDEIRFTLRTLRFLLKPGGLLLIADEVRPAGTVKHLLSTLLRAPLVALTYLLTQTTTKAVRDLPHLVEEAGFQIRNIRLTRLGNFMELMAVNPKADSR
jgi:demethylmenaquinone methyltransferase/2-methoxy-6-polyprenyl-1,4-benzoquinol methylase